MGSFIIAVIAPDRPPRYYEYESEDHCVFRRCTVLYFSWYFFRRRSSDILETTDVETLTLKMKNIKNVKKQHYENKKILFKTSNRPTNVATCV